ncbi:MAG: hypothetical protein AAFV69_08685 [Pseudomonadota bacterium]
MSRRNQLDGQDFHTVRVELARRSLIDFCRLMAPPTFVWGAAQVAICDHIQRCIDGDEFTQLQVNLPPRSGKSIISSIMTPAWFMGQHPQKKIILLTGNLLLTSQFIEQLISLLRSDEFKEVFPNLEVLDASVNRINFRDRRQPRGERGRLTTMSVSRAAQGVGANLLLSDDLISEQEAQSKEIKDKIWERYQSGITTRLAPDWNRQIVVATRWARDDPLGRMIAQGLESADDEPWEVLKVPAIVSADQAEDMNEIALVDPIFNADLNAGRVQLLTPGGTCSPERMSQKFLAARKAKLTPEQWAALYLQNPAPEQGTIFRKSMFRGASKAMIRELKSKVTYTIMTCDLALKADEQHDYSAAILWGVVPHIVKCGGQEYTQSTIVALRAWQDRIPAVDLVGELRHLYAEWKPNQIVIEDAASGTQAIQEMRRSGMPVVGFNVKKLPKGAKSKVERATLAALSIAQQPIFFADADAEVQAAIQQALEFPRSDHDDLVDCLSCAVLYLRRRNDFDSSFDTMLDSNLRLQEEIDPPATKPVQRRLYGSSQQTSSSGWKPERRSMYGHRQSTNAEHMWAAKKAADAEQVDPYHGEDVFDFD